MGMRPDGFHIASFIQGSQEPLGPIRQSGGRRADAGFDGVDSDFYLCSRLEWHAADVDLSLIF